LVVVAATVEGGGEEVVEGNVVEGNVVGGGVVVEDVVGATDVGAGEVGGNVDEMDDELAVVEGSVPSAVVDGAERSAPSALSVSVVPPLHAEPASPIITASRVPLIARTA